MILRRRSKLPSLDRVPLVQNYFKPHNLRARRAYTAGWFRAAGRVGGFLGAAAVAAASNLAAQVPRFQGDFRVNRKMPRSPMDLLPAYEPPNKKAKVALDGGGYTQTKYLSDRAGRKLDKVQRLMKILASQMRFKVDRFAALTDQTANSSFYPLDAWYSGTAGTRITQLPVYAMDLTSVCQKTTTVLGASQNPNPLLRLTFADAVDTYGWTPITALDSSSTATYSWETIAGSDVTASATADATDNTPAAFIGKVKIGMVITGARKYASTVWIQLVQFTDEDACPGLYASNIRNNAGTLAEALETDTQKVSERKKFWLSQTQFLLENPLNKKVVGSGGNKMKILYSKKFQYNPTITTENDPSGHETVFNLTYHMDKIVRYDISPVMTAIDDIDLADVNLLQTEPTNTSLYPACHKKGRVYLLIRSSAPSVAAADPGATSYDNYCSFDLSVQRTMHRLSGEAVTV